MTIPNKNLLNNLPEFLNRLRKAYKTFDLKPLAAEYRRSGRSVYELLIATILSLRTKDPTTYAAADRLFAKAKTPKEMIKLSAKEIQDLIYPVGFYRNKSKQIIKISRILLDKYNGEVPCDRDKLLELPGAGLKTANLVMAEGFGEPYICVDTHVHRISNRLGLIDTETPEETERALREVLPKEYWIEYPDLIVAYGQNICVPVSPFCDSKCVVSEFCPRIGVKVNR